MAAQLTGTNGPPWRGLDWWMARATSSLPVPLSPRSSTVASESATARIRSSAACIAGERPSRASQAEALLDLRAQAAILLPQAAVLERALDGQADLAQLERLGQIVVGALAHGLDGRLQAAEGRHEDHAGAGLALLGRAQEGQAVDLVHHEVGEDHVDLLALDGGQGARSAGRGA